MRPAPEEVPVNPVSHSVRSDRDLLLPEQTAHRILRSPLAKARRARGPHNPTSTPARRSRRTHASEHFLLQRGERAACVPQRVLQWPCQRKNQAWLFFEQPILLRITSG